MTNSTEEAPFAVNDFKKALVSWFQREGKDYPWRRTNDPWKILVSEVMLQQTTIPTILKRYEPWLEQFPTPQTLAQADEETALRSWEGLGYYQRIRNLQKTALAVTKQYQGKFPADIEKLRALPGIGPYTSAAVASFAFHLPAPLVDANVARVFSRLFNDFTPIDSTQGIKILQNRALILLDYENPHAYNSALMELGQTYCKKNPECLLCPVRDFCTAKNPETLPIKKPKTQTKLVTEYALFIQNSKNEILLCKTIQGKRRHGLYRLPLRPQGTPYFTQKNKQFSHKFSITHHKVTQHIYTPNISELKTFTPLENEIWIPLNHLETTPLASPDRKALNKLLKR